jgi:hypothetical protein
MDGFEIKVGDSFGLSCEAEFDGAPLDLTGYAIACHVRKGGALVDTMSVVVTDAVLGQYNLYPSIASRTQNWPVGDLVADIQYSRLGVVVHTEDFFIVARTSQTRGAGL